MMPAVAKLVEAVEQSPSPAEATEPGDAAFHLAFGDTFFDYKEEHSDHMVQFGLFVDAFASGIEADTAECIARAYAWEELPAGSLVVDDFGDLVEKADLLWQTEGVFDRVRFRPYDFFDPHPETSRGAAVYFLRNITHNWPDSYCRRILKPIVDAMNQHSRIIICEIVLPEPNAIPKTQEARVRALDMVMLSMYNAKERSYDDWQELFTSVDHRLTITAVVGRPKLGTDSLIEARLVQ